jgi:hypothetical protein
MDQGRRYLGLDVLSRSRISSTTGTTTEPTEVTTTGELQALSA